MRLEHRRARRTERRTGRADGRARQAEERIKPREPRHRFRVRRREAEGEVEGVVGGRVDCVLETHDEAILLRAARILAHLLVLVLCLAAPVRRRDRQAFPLRLGGKRAVHGPHVVPVEVALAVHVVDAERERAPGDERAAHREAEPRAAAVLVRRALAISQRP